MLHDVVIVGAGPVGLMLACELRLAGTPVVVLESGSEGGSRAPGVAINAGVIELLEMRGLMDACRADGFEFPMAHFAHIWLDPTQLADRYPYNFAIPHSRVVHHLAERARSLGADLRWGQRVVEVTQDEQSVRTRVDTPSGAQTLRSRYLVGCDGVGSLVRQAAGIGFPGDEKPFHGTVAELAVDPDSPFGELVGAREYPAGLVAVTPLGPGQVRVLTGEFGVEPPRRDGAPTLAEIQDSVRRITGVAVTGGTMAWSARWFHVTRLAERYRAGRIFVAGDAAHTHFPLGGQALSTGMDDAVNLGWKLAADLGGRAPDGLLDTYHTERHPAGARACQTSRAQVALLHPLTELRDIVAELVRFPDVNEYLGMMVGGTDTRYAVEPAGGDAHPLAGRRLPGIAAAAQAVPGLAAAWAAGRPVLLDLSGDDSLGQAVSGWADRVTLLRSAPLPAVDAGAVLLRPDGRVAWARPVGGDTAGLPAALSAFAGAPAQRALSTD